MFLCSYVKYIDMSTGYFILFSWVCVVVEVNAVFNPHRTLSWSSIMYSTGFEEVHYVLHNVITMLLTKRSQNNFMETVVWMSYNFKCCQYLRGITIKMLKENLGNDKVTKTLVVFHSVHFSYPMLMISLYSYSICDCQEWTLTLVWSPLISLINNVSASEDFVLLFQCFCFVFFSPFFVKL